MVTEAERRAFELFATPEVIEERRRTEELFKLRPEERITTTLAERKRISRQFAERPQAEFDIARRREEEARQRVIEEARRKEEAKQEAIVRERARTEAQRKITQQKARERRVREVGARREQLEAIERGERELLEEKKQIARAIQEGKRVEFIPEGVRITRLPTREEIPLEVTPVEPKTIARLRAEAATAQARGEISARAILTGITAGVAASLVGTGRFVRSIVTKPKETITEVGRGAREIGRRFVGEGFPEIGRVVRAEPAFATGFVAAEVAQARGAGIVVKKTGQVASKIATRLSPKFRAVEKIKGVEIIRDIPSKVARTKPLDIRISGPLGPKEFLPIRKQVEFAGKQVDAVSGAKGLFSKVIKKQIKVSKQIPKGAPKLEAAFFAEPRSRLRISRIGIEDIPEAKLLDILAGDVAFRGPKPQAILFERARVAKFPTKLKDVEKALKAGRTLTPKQVKRLTEFQLKPTGEFKPIGFPVSPEVEIALAPGEIIRKVDVPAVTIIKGKRVPIIKAEVVKAPARTAELQVKAAVKGLTGKEVAELTRRLTKETGFPISRITLPSRPVISPTRIAASVLRIGRIARAASKEAISPRRIERITKISPVPSPKRRVSITRAIRRASRAPVSVPGISPPISPRLLAPIITPPAKLVPFVPTKVKKKKKTLEQQARDDVAISEGFIARVLKLEPEKIKVPEVIKEARRLERVVGIRRAPIVRQNAR